MLVLSRKVGERILLSGSIAIVVVSIDGNKVRVGIEAPPSVAILREELVQRRDGNTTAQKSGATGKASAT